MLRRVTWSAAVAVAIGLLGSAPAGRQAGRAGLPDPAEVFGFAPGTDRHLADFTQITTYFRRLDAASERVRVFGIGQTAEGREMILSVISSEENLARLDRHRDIARQLADGRGLTDEGARALAREGRVMVWVDMGLHATEVAHGQVSVEVARAVAGDESDEMRRIRENAIVVLVPVMNPDGLDIVSRWYGGNVGTPFETSPLPVLYQEHAGHDNNRDWFMQNLPETQNITHQLYGVWYPQILYNHHQSGLTSPRIWAPPMDDPVNPNMHALIQRGISLLGVGIMQRLEQEGKTGAQGYSTYSNWWNGGMRSTPCFHNIVGILTETASGRYATPVELSPERLPKMLASGEDATRPSTWNPSPWRGGTWRLRDQMDYMYTATMAVLRLAGDYREDWLYNRYQMARDQVAAGRRGDPFAFVIPRDQHDWPTAVALARTLDRGAVEVHRAAAAFQADGRTYPAGSLVVLMAQPHRGYAKDLLEAQHHPDRRQGPEGPPKPPYDMAGWTLSYQMGVRADAVKNEFAASLARVGDFESLARSELPPPGGPVVIDRRINAAVKAVMGLLKVNGRVTMMRDAFIADVRSGPAIQRLADLGVLSATLAPGGPGQPLRMPRVGLYRSYVASMDEGWTRFVLEEFDVPYERLTNADIQAGKLRARADVIILPDQEADTILDGHAPGSMPAEYVGGIGVAGVAALKAFVEDGGTLVAIDDASELPLKQFGLPVRNAVEGLSNRDFYCPGSLLRLEIDRDAPLTAGMPAEAAAFFVRGRALAIDPAAGTRVRILARYARSNLLMSGWINGPEHIAGQAAAVDVSLGRGHVVLIGFGAQFRGQPHGTFKFLLNPILEASAGSE